MLDDADQLPEIDWGSLDYSKPCELLNVLQPKYFTLLAKKTDEKVRIEGRRYRIAHASIIRFGTVIRDLEKTCIRLQKIRVRVAANSRRY